MKKIYIYSKNVCERRKLDARRIANYFTINGNEIVSNPKNADIIILSTCGATGECTDLSFSALKKLSKYSAEIIVTGCVPATDKKKFDEVFSGKSIIAEELDEFDKSFAGFKIKLKDVEDTNRSWITEDQDLAYLFSKMMYKFSLTKKVYFYCVKKFLSYIFGDCFIILENSMRYIKNDYYYITTSWGCSQNCSYCGTKFAVGKFHSKPIDKCVEEFKSGLKKGFTKFDIEGEDIGGYGIDIGKTFPDLLDELTKIEGKYNITLSTLNPIWFVKYKDEILDILSRGKIKCIIIPIQSGNSRILTLMRRYSNIDKMRKAIMQVKSSYPDIAIGTHSIIGFPTETFNEFRDTLDFIKEVNFNMGIINLMSFKSGAEAEKISPRISIEEINRRKKYAKKYLRKLGYRIYPTKKALTFG
ncbi:MAG: radical SAM protein [Euryarchaeota archaeon]|nr:radical SAM protein [Euryarchaeota archaeon]